MILSTKAINIFS